MRCLLTFLILGILGSPVAAQSIGSAAPDFSYPRLGGGTLALSDYEGKVVFVFLFGNTCPFCLAVGNRTETEVNATFGSNPNFQAVGLDLWTSTSNAASVSTFRSRTGITYPLGLQAGSMASLYQTTYDRVLVIGADGVLRYKGSSATSSTLVAATGVIENLLASISTGIEEEPRGELALAPAYPNPFSDHTTLTLLLPESGSVHLTVYDLLGRRVAVLADGFLTAGRHEFTWDGVEGLPAGLYTTALKVGGQRITQSVVLSR